ncbi:MAG: hypothetical protein ACYDIA_01855 [Candidatus Humimicrobiaceae bacterium]
MTEQFFREFYISNKDKIQQLEKELKEAKAKLSANRFIFKTKTRNEYLDKIEDLELQRDGQSITIGQLKKENTELKTKFEKNYILPKFNKHKKCNCAVCRYVKGVEELLGETEYHKYSKLLETIEGDYELANINELEELSIQNYELKNRLEKMQEENYDYESQLKEIKTLNRQEVEKIFEVCREKPNIDIPQFHINAGKAITAILNLALPQVRTSPFTDEQNLVVKEKSKGLKGYHEVNEFYEPKSKEEIDKDKIVEVFDRVIGTPYIRGAEIEKLFRIESIEHLANEIIKEINE